MDLYAQLGLPAASALASFLLRTAVEWLAIIALVRTVTSARLRAHLWLGMLAALAGQWVWMLAGMARWVFSVGGAPDVGRGAGVSALLHAEIAIPSGAAPAVTLVMAVLLVAYCAGTMWQLSCAVAMHMRRMRALRYRREPDRRLREIFQRAKGGRDLRCTLSVLPGLASPATLGWLHPLVLLPAICETRDEAEVEAVFWHELKHVEQRDALWNGVAGLCRSLAWFHPGAHFAMRGLVAERELACDAEVVAEHPEQRGVYATCLVRFARAVDLAPAPGVAAVEMASRATQLSVRVRSILAERPRPGVPSRVARGLACASIAAATLWALPNLGVALYAELATIPAARADLPIATQSIAHPARRPAIPRDDAMAPAPAIALASSAPAASHDEALAAAHRVGMGVLTESTGMEQPGDDANGVTSEAAGVPRQQSHASGTLASVAVDAAERMGPLLADHDSDDRH